MVSRLTQSTILVKKPAASVPLSAVPQSSVEGDLVAWIKQTVHSCQDLASVLERLRNSYVAMLAGGGVSDADEILIKVEAALRNSKSVRDFA
jgi:hypothetical protein